MSIYVIFHKKYPLLTNDSAYRPIHVGKALSSVDLGFDTDNTGENISHKNPYYSELTGLYWIWKNTNSEYVGLSHYRRFFLGDQLLLSMRFKKVLEYLILQGRKRAGVYYTSNLKTRGLILPETKIQQLLSDFDAIVPKRRKLRYSVYKQYKRKHIIEDMDKTRAILAEKFPDYLVSFDKSMQQKEIMHCNMFILKRAHFNDYMEWLFTILFELEKNTDISDYDNYQRRLFGFISERLFDVWLQKKQLKIKSLDLLYFKKLKI